MDLRTLLAASLKEGEIWRTEVFQKIMTRMIIPTAPHRSKGLRLGACGKSDRVADPDEGPDRAARRWRSFSASCRTAMTAAAIDRGGDGPRGAPQNHPGVEPSPLSVGTNEEAKEGMKKRREGY
jgi:hypothetical protein